MSKTKITEADISTLHHALRVASNPELDGIYASGGGKAAQFGKLVRRGLLEYSGMGETDDERHLPCALYNITDAGKALLEERAKGAA